MSLCFVSATFTAKEGHADALLAAIRKIVPIVRAEEGCISYSLHRNMKNPNRCLFYEKWASPDALEAHGKTPHMAKFFQESQQFLDGPGEIEVWEAVDVQG